MQLHLLSAFCVYRANTSVNSLVEKLLREGKTSVKQTFEDSLKGEVLHLEIDEQIVYNQLSKKNDIWSLFACQRVSEGGWSELSFHIPENSEDW